jgi:uncharacterized protein YndB with AHSA1/START domain
MGVLTSGRVEIAAPASEVFDWLVDPVKLTAWLGAADGMPEDAAQVHVGWSNTTDTPELGRVTVEITGYDPPHVLEYRTTNAGGDSLTTYRLVEGDGVTTVALEGDTDRARPAWDAEDVGDQLQRGVFDDLGQSQMQQALDASLQKLKALIEAG